jgi:hypothetical protein
MFLTVAVGCAAPARVDVSIPPELPLVTNDQLFEFRWVLQRDPSVTRAVGVASISSNAEFYLTLALFGLDPEGRIASRGQTYVQSDFSRRAVPFSVEVKPTGREARYELRVLDYYVTGVRPD